MAGKAATAPRKSTGSAPRASLGHRIRDKPALPSTSVNGTTAQALTPRKTRTSVTAATSRHLICPDRRIGIAHYDTFCLTPAPPEVDTRKAIFLDIDSLLHRYPQLADLRRPNAHAYCASLGMAPAEADKLIDSYSRSYGLALRPLVNKYNLDPLEFERQCDAALPLEQLLAPEPALVDLLSQLDRTKCRVVVVTNSYNILAERALRCLGIMPWIEACVFCDYALAEPYCKPDAKFYLAAMDAVGVGEGEQCYFVDGSLENVQAAKALGWHSCIFFDPPATTLSKESAGEQTLSAGFDSSIFDAPPMSFSPNGLMPSRISAHQERIQHGFAQLCHAERVELVSMLFEVCTTAELATLSKTLDQHLRRTRDTITQLADKLSLHILRYLDVPDLLRCRRVCTKWSNLTRTPSLWESQARRLTWGDPVPLAPPTDPSGWEGLVKGLFWRERNWAQGLAQTLDFFPGHTGYVTSIKIKGRTTLVTGSYDETVRVWDLQTGKCTKTLQAKAISCLDFLPDENILCAGLYDSGRVMVWDMRSWELLQTLSGHNKGIRHVALSHDYLISCGQDKAIVVWDWRSGSKIVRFGQQSNVSLGVSIVDQSKIVAVTVDGMIRTFSIPQACMIEQFDLHKLGGPSTLGAKAMLQWFHASAKTITVASKQTVVHLQWKEHFVPVEEYIPPSEIRKIASARSASAAASVRRNQQESGSLSIHTQRSSSSMSIRRSPSRVSLAPSSPASPTTPHRGALEHQHSDCMTSPASVKAAHPRLARASNGGRSIPQLSPSEIGSRAASSAAQRALGRGAPPLARPRRSLVHYEEGDISRDTINNPLFPSGDVKAKKEKVYTGAMRYAPDLAAPPRIVEVLHAPDIATGAVDAAKQRIVCSTFSSRAGSDRRLYVSTYQTRDTPDPRDAGNSDQPVPQEAWATGQFVPLSGAWSAHQQTHQAPSTRPLAMVVDHESLIVGCQDGTLYRIGFVGDAYRPTSEHERANGIDGSISSLSELAQKWRELTLPSDVPHEHYGHLRPAEPVKAPNDNQEHGWAKLGLK